MFKRLFRKFRNHEFDLNKPYIKKEWGGKYSSVEGYADVIWYYFKCKKCKEEHKTTYKYNLIGLKGCPK